MYNENKMDVDQKYSVLQLFKNISVSPNTVAENVKGLPGGKVST
jgi:hypothetical protein